MEAGSIDPQEITADEISKAVKLVPEIRAAQTNLEHILIGVPVNGHREGGLMTEFRDLQAFTRTIFYTVLAANVFGGMVATALYLLIK